MKCPSCRGTLETRRENYRYDQSGLPNVTLLDVEVRHCPSCGLRAPVIPRLDDLHRALALAVIKKRGRLSPMEVRFLRRYMGWSGADFARHFGVDASTVSRWENKTTTKPIGPQADRLLRLVVAYGRPVEEYPIENLVDIDGDDAAPERIGLRAGKNGWESQSTM